MENFIMNQATELIHKIRTSGGNPSAAYVAKRCGITEQEAQDEINRLAESGIQAVNQGTGKPVRRTRTGRNDKTSDIHRTTGPARDIEGTAKAKRTLREHVQAGLTALLPFVFFGAAIAGSIRSYTMANSFFSRINGSFDSMLMAGLLVSISFGTPQAIPILWSQVRSGKRIPMFIVACVVSVASIGTNATISILELSSQRNDSGSAAKVSDVKRQQIEARIAELTGRIQDAREDLKIDKEERQTLLTLQKTLEIGTVEYNRTRNNAQSVKDRIDRGMVSIDEMTTEIGGLRNKLAELPATSSRVVSGDMETFVNVSIAFLLEVGSPLCLALSFFL